MSSPVQQGVSIFKPVILAGLNAILPVFSGTYTDEFSQPFTVQMRGAFSTERRMVPNVVVSYRPGATNHYSGRNLADFNPNTGRYVYGIYQLGARLRYTVQGRNEAEREWLVDSLATAFTGLVFTQPSTGVFANNNLVDYLGSQGIVVTGWDAPDYPEPVLSDTAAPRPEGQVYEATFPVIVDVSLTYEMAGRSASAATLNSAYSVATNPALPASGAPSGGVDPTIYLSAP